MSTLIASLIKTDGFIEQHLSQCHGAILPRADIIGAFTARINAAKPPRLVSDRYVESRMQEAGIRSEALLNWFYFFCEQTSSEDFAGFWFYSLRSVENPVQKPVEAGA